MRFKDQMSEHQKRTMEIENGKLPPQSGDDKKVRQLDEQKNHTEKIEKEKKQSGENL